MIWYEVGMRSFGPCLSWDDEEWESRHNWNNNLKIGAKMKCLSLCVFYVYMLTKMSALSQPDVTVNITVVILQIY